MNWNLKRTRQCAKCPWKVSTNPHEIPNGYSREKHEGLRSTIAIPGDFTGLSGQMHVMACHETQDAHCLGWLMHQLGPGNNIALRLHVRNCGNIGDVVLDGPQHPDFDSTLPAGGDVK